MADKKNPLGATGRTVASNVARLRSLRRLSYAELSRRLDEFDRPIATLGLSRIESEERRVDADDLVALAAALNVSPISLLMPDASAAGDLIDSTPRKQMPARALWDWMQSDKPLFDDGTRSALLDFFMASYPEFIRETLDHGMFDFLHGRRKDDIEST